jgi:hypothetical protein
MRRWLVAALACLALATARADDDVAPPPPPPPPPMVRALLLLPMPNAPVIQIEPRDDSDENLRLRDLMIARLGEPPGRVADDAALVLRFSLDVISGRDTPRDGPGNRFGRLGGGRAPPNAVARDTPVSYRLSATLEQRNGAMVWRAEVTAPLLGQDDGAVAARLAAALIDNIGRSVNGLPATPPR